MDYYCKTKNGNFWVSDLDTSQSIELYHFKVWEQHLLDVIEDYVIPGTVAIDAGANIGSISVPISKKLGSDGKLYSFEMSGKMTERLKKNLRENSCSNVTVKNNPLSDTVDETVSFEEIDDHSKSNFGDIRINKENKGVKATTTTIDNTNINRPVSFIKVDCQGYDLKVMKGAKKTIEKYRPVVIFEWEEEMSQVFGDTLEDVFDFFEDLDYEVNRIHKDDWIARPIK